MGFVPIEGALGAVKTGFDLVKGVRDLLKREKVNPSEVSGQLLEIQNFLLEARGALVEASEYIAKLENDLAAKMQIDELDKLMLYDQTVYWKRTGNGDGVEPDPYCAVCWEKDQRLAHLRPGATKGTYICLIDRTSYQTNAYDRRPTVAFRMRSDYR
jgi:hypothetical protein